MPIYEVELVADIYKTIKVEALSHDEAKKKAKLELDGAWIHIQPQDIWYAMDSEVCDES